MEEKEKREKRYRRHKRVKKVVKGTAERPRLVVFRSLKHIYCQVINDEKGQTIVSASDLEVKEINKGNKEKSKKVSLAFEVGKLIAKKAKESKIEKVAFDRGGYKYHGRVKSLAEGAREGGLKF